MHKKYHGIIPPIITPILENEDVDEGNFRKLLEHCVVSGLHGIFVAGTNGESLALTQRERNRAIKIAIDQVAGRIPVIAGVMDTSTRRVVDNIKELEQMGGTCAAVTSIFYDRHTSQDETIRHFEAISSRTGVDLMIYNMPLFTGVKLLPQTVLAIAEFDRVVGYKDSSGAFGEFMQVLIALGDTPFSCMQGATPVAVAALLMGADGFVPALAPLFPEIFIGAYESGRDKNVPLARRYNVFVQETSKLLGMSKNATAATKAAVAQLGFNDGRVIVPQDVLLEGEEERIRAKTAEIREQFAAFKAGLTG